jgi:hypothetical protein
VKVCAACACCCDRATKPTAHAPLTPLPQGHRLKNFDCKLLRELRQLSTDARLLLTGGCRRSPSVVWVVVFLPWLQLIQWGQDARLIH